MRSGSLRIVFFFSSRRRHTRLQGDWSSDVCSSDLEQVTKILQVAGGFAPEAADMVRYAIAKKKSDVMVKAKASFDSGCLASGLTEIGRASCRKECRSRWSPYH